MAMKQLLISSATLFGLGKRFPAPGTVGSLVTLPVAFAVSLLGPFAQMGVTLLLMVYAVCSCEAYERASGTHDLGEVIIDESVGIFISTVWLPASWPCWLTAFFLFRFFDILKPFPISYLDRNIKGGVGVVADDVAAGIVASAILQWLLQSQFLPSVFLS